MKILKRMVPFLLLGALLIGAASCEKGPEKELIGTWNLYYEQLWEQSASAMGFSAGSSDVIVAASGKMIFNEDGTGKLNISGEDEMSFTWSSTDPDELSILIDGRSNLYQNETDKKDKQVWKQVLEGQSASGSVNGVSGTATNQTYERLTLTK